MSTVDLGGASSSGGSLKYTATTDTETVKPNNSYLLSFLVSRLNVDDSAAAEGDFIRFKTDYAQTDKVVTFSKPVVIGDDLFTNGEITVSNELELYYNGFTWQDSSSSTAPILDVGVFATSTSKQILVSDLANTVFDKPLHLIIEVVGGCGGATNYATPAGAQAGVGGGAGGYAAVELVIFPDVSFPVIDFLSGAGGKNDSNWDSRDVTDGGASTLKINTHLIAELFGGKKGGWNHSVAAHGAGSVYYDSSMSFLYNEIVKGNDSTKPKHYSNELSCKYRTIPSEYCNQSYRGFGGKTALGNKASNAGDGFNVAYSSSGRIQITYRPATSSEIAAQEALNA